MMAPMTWQLALTRNVRASVFYILAIAMSVFMFLPFFWSLMTSIKPDEEIFSFPIRWLPSRYHVRALLERLPDRAFGLYFGTRSFSRSWAC